MTEQVDLLGSRGYLGPGTVSFKTPTVPGKQGNWSLCSWHKSSDSNTGKAARIRLSVGLIIWKLCPLSPPLGPYNELKNDAVLKMDFLPHTRFSWPLLLPVLMWLLCILDITQFKKLSS